MSAAFATEYEDRRLQQYQHRLRITILPDDIDSEGTTTKRRKL
jgi:hypothetical protein